MSTRWSAARRSAQYQSRVSTHGEAGSSQIEEGLVGELALYSVRRGWFSEQLSAGGCGGVGVNLKNKMASYFTSKMGLFIMAEN